jgi:DNA-binding MarR family transcriptional regulator
MVKSLHDMETTLDRLLAVTVLLNEDATQSLAKEGLTLPRAHLLWHLHHEGASTQRVLADALRVSPRNVTGLVDGLAEAGFVTRSPHPSDRRATLVSLTERGAGSMAQLARDHQALAELLFGELRDFAAFAAGLEHVLAKLSEALGR